MAVILPPVPQVVRLQFTGLYNSSPWLVGLFFHYNAPTLITGDINSICQSAATAWGTHWAPMHSTAVQLRRVSGIDLRAPDAAQGGMDVNIPGTRIASAITNQVCAVQSWKVNFRWRGGHFRSYWPAGTSGDFVNGKTWSQTYLTSLNAAADGFFGAMNGITVGGTGGHLSGVRYFSQGALLPVPLDLPIVDTVVHSRVDTQRRRLGKEVA